MGATQLTTPNKRPHYVHAWAAQDQPCFAPPTAKEWFCLLCLTSLSQRHDEVTNHNLLQRPMWSLSQLIPPFNLNARI